MKPNDTKILHQRKEDLAKRLERKQWPEQPNPLLRAQNIHYEMAERVRAIDCGGIGAFHLLACHSGLVEALNDKVHLLKKHLPYHESDHVLNIAYNTLILMRDNESNYAAYADGLNKIMEPTCIHVKKWIDEHIVY